MLKLLKEIFIVIKDIHSRMIEENKADRMNNLERNDKLFQGNQEVFEQRLRAMEKHLGVEYVQESVYKKVN